MAETTVIKFPSKSRGAPDEVLERSKEYGLKSAVVVGFTEKGDLFYSSSDSVGNELAIVLLSLIKADILEWMLSGV